MRVLQKIKLRKPEAAIQTAKSSDGGSVWIKTWAPILLVLLLVEICLLVFVVPLIAGVYVSALNHDLVNYLAAAMKKGFLRLWEILVLYPGWKNPAMVVSIFVSAFVAAIGFHTSNEAKRNTRSPNMIGPAADPSNSKGSAGVYGDPELIKELNYTMGKNEIPPYGAIAIGCIHYGDKDGEKSEIILGPKESHGLIVGTTGAGKTKIINEPSLVTMAKANLPYLEAKKNATPLPKDAPEPCSCVVLDPKGELYADVAPYLRSIGLPVHIIDFRNPERSECWNALQPIVDVFMDKKVIYDEKMAAARELATKKGIPAKKMSDDMAWGDSESYLEFKKLILQAESAKKAGWSRAEELTRDVALGIIPEDGSASSGAAHWLDVARMLLESLILWNTLYTEEDYIGGGEPYPEPYPEQRNLPSVMSILRKYAGEIDVQGKKKAVRELVELMSKIDPEHPASKAFAQIKASRDEEFATTLSEAIKFITKLISSSTEAILNRQDIDFGKLGEEPTFLFLVVPSDREAAARLFILLFMQIHQMLVERAARYGNRLPVRVNFLLEEFAAVCRGNKVNNLTDMLAVGRGYNLYLYITVQTLSQLSAIYKKDTLNTILDNCGTKVLLRSTDVEGTCEYFSKAVGKYTYKSESEARSKRSFTLFDSGRTRTYREEQRDYFTADELANWPEEWGALVLQSKPGKKPTKKARRLGYNGIMKPLVVPTQQSWQNFVGEILGTTDRAATAEATAQANKESRIYDRVPLVPWNPKAKSAEERAITKQRLYGGGISIESKKVLQRQEDRENLKKQSRAFSAPLLDWEMVAKKGVSYIDKLLNEWEKLAADAAKEQLAAKQLSEQERQVLCTRIEANAAAMRLYWYKDLIEILETGTEPDWLKKYRGDFSEVAQEEKPISEQEFVPINSETIQKTSACETELLSAMTSESCVVAIHKKASHKRDNAWLDDMRRDIEECRRKSGSVMEFMALLQDDYGITVAIQRGKRINYSYSGTGKVARDERLNPNYTMQNLEEYFKKKQASA